MDVVGEVIDVIEPRAFRPRVAGAEPLELVRRTLGAVAIDEIEQAAADTLDGGNVERLLRRRNVGRFRAERQRAVIGRPGVDHPERHRRRARAVGGDKVKTMGAGFFVDEVVDVALAVDRDLPGAVTRDRGIAHQLEQRVQRPRVGMRVFDELETIGTHRIVGADDRGRRVVRKWTHG